MQKAHIIRTVLAICFSVSVLIFITGCFQKKNHPVLTDSTAHVSPAAALQTSGRGGVLDNFSLNLQLQVPVIKLPEPKKPTVGLTVWIHGTVGSSFSIGDRIKHTLGGDSNKSLIGRFMHTFRNQPILHYDQVLGTEGFDIFDIAKYDATTSASEAAYYVIPAYKDVAHAAGMSLEIEEHAIFGWDGFLSQQARHDAAAELYDALVSYRDQIVKKYGVEPRIRILAHSHGGNVALWLADFEKERQKKLSIDLLFMYGTPMQVETGHCITSPFFKRIFLGYSRGDSIQRRDYFSTTRRKSFMRMSDVVDISNFVHDHQDCVRADVGFMIGGDDKRVTHTNMWLLGRSVPIFTFMDPLPLVVLTPIMVAALDRVEDGACTHFKADLTAQKKRCWVMLTSCIDTPCRRKGVHKRRFERAVNQTEFRLCEKKVYKKLVGWSTRMMVEWRPIDPSRDVVFNLKNYHAISGAIHAL